MAVSLFMVVYLRPLNWKMDREEAGNSLPKVGQKVLGKRRGETY
jgi:hypothetical protein